MGTNSIQPQEILTDDKVGVAILAYLTKRKEENMGKASTHQVATKPPEFVRNSQQDGRILNILRFLEKKGEVFHEKISAGRYWAITDTGLKNYKEIMKRYQEYWNFFGN